MKENRNTMFFPGTPGMGMPSMGQPGMMVPQQGMGGMGFPSPSIPNIGQLENRIASLERQVKRLDARIGRLETPFPTPTPFDGGTGQVPFTAAPESSPESNAVYPYQTSMQVM